MRIFATDKATGHSEEVLDLYWFEENSVHSFDDDRYTFEFQFGVIRVQHV